MYIIKILVIKRPDLQNMLLNSIQTVLSNFSLYVFLLKYVKVVPNICLKKCLSNLHLLTGLQIPFSSSGAVYLNIPVSQ